MLNKFLFSGITQNGGYNLGSGASWVPSLAGELKPSPFPNLHLNFIIYLVKGLILQLLRAHLAVIFDKPEQSLSSEKAQKTSKQIRRHSLLQGGLEKPNQCPTITKPFSTPPAHRRVYRPGEKTIT